MQETVIDSPVGSTTAGEQPLSFKMLIVYDSLAGLMRAKTMRYRLAGQFQQEIDIESKSWYFTLLANAQLFEQAADEAENSDMVLFALGNNTATSVLFKNWMEFWSERKGEGKTALVALLGEKGPEEASAFDYLQAKAAEGGMDFFCNTPGSEAELQLENIHRLGRERLPDNIIPQEFARRDFIINE
jgi:hypothetical protein